MLAHKARQASRRIEQVKRDGMRHHLGHEPHDFVLETQLYVRLALEELDPVGHRQASYADLGDRSDAVGDGGLQPPRGVGGVHIGFSGEAQDHLPALGVADDPLQDPLQDEELLHARAALAHQRLAFAVFRDLQLRLQVIPGGRRHFAQDQVLLELQANRVALGVVEDGRHGWRNLTRATGN